MMIEMEKANNKISAAIKNTFVVGLVRRIHRFRGRINDGFESVVPSNLFPSSSSLRTTSEHVDVETLNIHTDDGCMHMTVKFKSRRAVKIFINNILLLRLF